MKLQTLALAALVLLPAAHADGPTMPRAILPAYTAECAACHLAYPPAMLPTASWQRLMDGLQTHYGTDASLDAAAVREIGTWLEADAATSRRMAEPPPEDRITRSAWFVRKHRELAPGIWKLPSVMGPGNCAACHTGAARGRFGDHELQVPAGVPPSRRRAWND